jgi:hypothetical protein
MDMFVVPTISFRLLYGLLIMGHGRRQIVCWSTGVSLSSAIEMSIIWRTIAALLLIMTA